MLMFSLAAALITGCNTNAKSKGEPEKKEPLKTDSYPITITDQLGREIVLEKLPERIVSLSPSNTEILFSLGLEDRLVGVTDFCEYPEAAKSKEKVGGFADPSVEKIVSLKPDIVLTTDLHRQVVEQLDAMGISSVMINPGNMEEMLESIELIGFVTGVKEKAEALTLGLRTRIKAVSEEMAGIPDDKKPRVYYEIFPTPLITAGPNTFVDDIIKLTGGVNIAADANKAYPEYSQEMIVSKNPQIIIYSHHGSSQETVEDILGRTGWGSIDAIKEKRVFYIDEDIVQLATPRLVEGLEAVSRLLKENFDQMQ